ncbi:MAG TPA: lmo0937 family membrane protein [Ignavibacteriaceae bacterium]|nr:lmo0937 family membrane protein [Ignavibacteriaceae bacterium]
MYYINALVLAALWLIGFLTSTTMGGIIHVLLVIAILFIVARIISGRNHVRIGQGN